MIELLVVMTIIGVLAALLFPVVGGIRESAQRAVCISNLKQIMNATLLYAGEWGGHLPFPNEDSLEGGWWTGRGWLYRTPLSAPVTANALTNGALWVYIGDAKVYRCPTHKPPYRNGGTELITSYTMNNAAVGYNDQSKVSRPSCLLMSFGNTDVCYWETDERYGTGYGNTWQDGNNRPNGGITRRHKNGAPVACFGGQVEWMKYDEYRRLEQSSNKNRLWCSPVSANGH
jgi:type II secretory pathway pseudopilin PulG